MKTASLPWLVINMAITADGKICGPRASTNTPPDARMARFSSAADHRRLLRIRSTCDAVISGRKTVEADQVDLGPGSTYWQQRRVRQGLSPFNKRIVISSSGKIQPTCHVYQYPFSPLLIATTDAGLERSRPVAQTTDWIQAHSFGKTHVNLHALLAWLGAHWQVHRVVAEGGGELNDALFRDGLVDELFLTVCPIIFGGTTHGTLADGMGASNLGEAYGLRCVEHQTRNGEQFLRFLKSRPA